MYEVATVWAFIFVGMLCLMFIGMIYGEKLNVLGILEGRFFAPVQTALNSAWNELCRALDQTVLFVTEHASWVLAGASGSIGLFIISFLMFSGIAEDAAARNQDLRKPLNAGSVVDGIPEVVGAEDSPAILRASHTVDVTKSDDSEFLWQQPGTYVVFKRPELDRPVRRLPAPTIEFPPRRPAGPSETPLADRPQLLIRFDRLVQQSSYFDDETQSYATGRLIESMPLRNRVADSLARLRRDDWQQSFGNPIGLNRNEPNTTLRESTVGEIREAESNVRVIPGDAVAEHQLRIEKVFPSESAGNEITVEIRILNTGSETVSGLVVREYLPRNAGVRGTQPPDALFRDDTLIWVVNDLRPFDEQILQFTVLANPVSSGISRRPTFESSTEVSALTAVASRTLVRDDSRNRQPSVPVREPLPAVDEPLSIPPLGSAGRPDVRLRIDEPVDPVKVGQSIEVNFVVRNFGTAAAEGVGLRVTLDQGLSHHMLADDDPIREVVNSVRRLEPNETRTIPLRMRATRAGQFQSSAEMIFEGRSITSDSFRLMAEQIADPFPNNGSVR